MVSVTVEGVLVDALVDTGATVSVIRYDLCKRLKSNDTL